MFRLLSMKKKVAKVTKIKTNLYGPEINKEDRRDSLVGLMEDIAARRDHWANINGKETAVRWSFCVGPDTNILTNKGYFKAFQVDELNDETTLLWNGSAFVRKKAWISSGKQRSFLVKLTDSVITVSYNHPFRVKGKPVLASDLIPGTVLDVNQSMPDQIWSEEVYELGSKAQVTILPVESYQSFLKGLLDFKARVDGGKVIFSLRSLDDAESVLMMLEALGLYGTLSGKAICNVFEITLSKFSTQKCISILGGRNIEILKEIIRTNTDSEYYQDTRIVVSVEELKDEVEVFGPVEVDGEWYLSNGIISHNTPFTAKNQCLGPDEYVISSYGLVKVSDRRLFNDDCKIWNGYNFSSKEKWTKTENADALKITFTDNDQIIASSNHPFKSGGKTVIADLLNIGDKIDFSFSQFPQSKFSEKFYLYGLLRDACINTANGKINKIYFVNEPVDGFSYITDTLDYLKIKWSINKIGGKNMVAIGFDDEIEKLVGKVFKAPRIYRSVQKEVLENPQFFSSYISGVIDADGSIIKSRGTYTIRITQTSRDLAIQTMRILQFLGVDSSLSETKRSPNSKFDIRIKGGYKARALLYKLVTLKVLRKKNLLEESILNVPKMGKAHIGKKIKSIENIKIDVYGPYHLDGRWYISNGLYSHNTPLEYADCMGGLTNKKTLTPAVEASRKLGFKFRVGTAQEISTVAQVLTLGDRRLNKVIYRAYKEGILQYFGGMSVGKNILEPFAQLLKEETGHTYETYAQEKSLFQVFPWDFIDLGMTKEYRKERYLQSKEAALPDFSCFTHCIQCGACQTSQPNLPRRKRVDALDEFETL